MKPKIIKTEAEYEQALARLDAIFDAEPGTPEGDEAELLTALIEMYEEQVYPIDLPSPVDPGQAAMAELPNMLATVSAPSMPRNVANAQGQGANLAIRSA